MDNETDAMIVKGLSLLPVFTVIVTLYKHTGSNIERLTIRTNDQHGDGLSYEKEFPESFYLSRFDQMMEIATKEMRIRAKEGPPKRSSDPRQDSLIEGEDTPE